MDEYIREWLAIENIALHDFRHTFVEPLSNDNIDECNKINNKYDCEKNESCTIYKKSNNTEICVDRTRIKHFEATELSTTITGKDGNLYKIIDSINDIVGLDSHPNIYYYIILSVKTSNTYVLFSSYEVLTNKKLIQIDTRLLVPLVEKLHTKISNDTDKKIVLCGHSFGCVLALRTGKIFKDKYPEIFDKNIIIVGSAPFKYSNDSNSFSNLKNVIIFIHTATYEAIPNIIWIDCFANKGDSETNYKPVTYINTHIDQDNKYSYAFKTENDNGYQYDYISSDGLCNYYHRWENYFTVLSKLYPFQVKGGRNKPNKKYIINTKRYRNVRRSTRRKRKIYKR
jgi:hypothetical protein